MYRYRWKPSKEAKRAFAEKMTEIEEFCEENNISCSSSKESYYFRVNGQKYRVSNHSIEASNKRASYFNEMTGEYKQLREKYHPDEREEDVIYIHAGKTRIMEIYNDLKAGYKLDGRGNRLSQETDMEMG